VFPRFRCGPTRNIWFREGHFMKHFYFDFPVFFIDQPVSKLRTAHLCDGYVGFPMSSDRAL
jgi:hypothetical protein